MSQGKPDPLELKRKLLSGEIDADEYRRRKIEAYRAGTPRQKLPPNARRLVDPIEAQRQKLAKSAARRRQKTTGAVPRPRPGVRHLVVVVRPRTAPPRRDEGEEDFFTRRLREAREKLK